MNVGTPSQPDASKPRVARWLAWVVLILIGGTVLVAVVAAFVSAVVDGLDTRKLPALLAIVLFAVLFTCLKAAFHPICGRTDERNAWREQFPTHSEQEVQRFLQIVVGGLGLRQRHLCKLRPDDRVKDLDPSLGMDIGQLIMALEKEYALDLPDSFLETARTLGDLFDYVTRHAHAPHHHRHARFRHRLVGAEHAELHAAIHGQPFADQLGQRAERHQQSRHRPGYTAGAVLPAVQTMTNTRRRTP